MRLTTIQRGITMKRHMTKTMPRRLAHPRPIRLYQDNDTELKELATKVDADYAQAIVQLIRDCVDAGLPIIKRRFKL